MVFPEAHVRRDRVWRQWRAFGVPGELLQNLTLQPSPPRGRLWQHSLTVAKKREEMGRDRFNNETGFPSRKGK